MKKYAVTATLAVALLSGFAVAGCGGGGGGSSSSSSSATQNTANDVPFIAKDDLQYIDALAPHHKIAIQEANLELQKGTRTEMNYVAASCEVSHVLRRRVLRRLRSEQLHLLQVETRVLLLRALLPHIAANGLLAAVAAYRVHKEAIRPERPAPKLLLDRRDAAEDLAGSDALDGLHDPRRAERRNRLHQEVDMVAVCANLKEHDLVAGRDLQAGLPQDLVHFRQVSRRTWSTSGLKTTRRYLDGHTA